MPHHAVSRCQLWHIGVRLQSYLNLSMSTAIRLVITLLLAAQLISGQADPDRCPLAPEEDVALEQLLISASPQGCLRKLIGADLAACFHRQIWEWDGSRIRECPGISRYAYAAVTGVGNPDSTACPAPGTSLGYMESFSTITATADGQLGQEGRNEGQLAELDAVEDCSSTSGDVGDQVCQLTLNRTCNLVYKVITGEPEAGGTRRSPGIPMGDAGSRPDTMRNTTAAPQDVNNTEMNAAVSRGYIRAMALFLPFLVVLLA